MPKKKTILWLLFFCLLVIASLYFDGEISKFLAALRNNVLTEIFLGITFLSSEIIIFFFLTSLFLWEEHKRRWIFPLWLGLFLSVVASLILKISVQRLRPFQTGIVSLLGLLEKSGYAIWDFSLPSFHTMLAFSAVPILAMEFPRFKKVWIILALLIGLVRVYFGLHYLSDVLIGGAIGLCIGFLMVKLETEKKYGEKIIKKFWKK